MPDQLVVLAEDDRSANLLRRYAKRLPGNWAVVLRTVPAGAQAAEQFVREKFAEEVRLQRRATTRCALLVHIDADTSTFESRLRQLDEALKSGKEPPRMADERIVVLVPKRNTETWLHALTGHDADEEYDYKSDPDHRVATNTVQRDRVQQDSIRAGADRLFDLTRRNAAPPPGQIPSLVAAVGELKRLEP